MTRTTAGTEQTPDIWRVGRKVGRTLYLQHSDEPSDADQLVGLLDTTDLAQQAVDALNHTCGPPSPLVLGEGSRECSCGGWPSHTADKHRVSKPLWAPHQPEVEDSWGWCVCGRRLDDWLHQIARPDEEEVEVLRPEVVTKATYDAVVAAGQHVRGVREIRVQLEDDDELLALQTRGTEAYIIVSREPVTRTITREVNIDLDAGGTVVGIELLDVTLPPGAVPQIEDPTEGDTSTAIGFTEAELRDLWQVMESDRGAYPLLARRLACMAAALLGQLDAARTGRDKADAAIALLHTRADAFDAQGLHIPASVLRNALVDRARADG